MERYSLTQSIRLGFLATCDLVANVYRGMWLTVSRPLYYREYLGGPPGLRAYRISDGAFAYDIS